MPDLARLLGEEATPTIDDACHQHAAWQRHHDLILWIEANSRITHFTL